MMTQAFADRLHLTSRSSLPVLPLLLLLLLSDLVLFFG